MGCVQATRRWSLPTSLRWTRRRRRVREWICCPLCGWRTDPCSPSRLTWRPRSWVSQSRYVAVAPTAQQYRARIRDVLQPGLAPQLYAVTEIPCEGITCLIQPTAHRTSPRDSACAWLTNLPVHFLPPSFT